MIIIPDVAGGYRGLIYITEEGLIYRRTRKGDIFYEWKRITNIFPWGRFNLLTIIDEDQNVSSGFVFADRKYGRPLKKIDYIFRVWGDKIQQKSESVYFEYPAWCRKQDSKSYVENAFWGLAGGMVIIAIALAAMRENNWQISNIKEDWPIALGFLFGLYGLVFGVSNLIKRRRKKVSEIKVGENNLKIIYEDGSSKQFELTQVRKHNLAKRRYKGEIIFKDASKIEHLERVSYWPILREYLLSKLQLSEEE